MKDKLTVTARSPYRISANERVKLPAEFLQRWALTPGKHDVWMYMTGDGELLVSVRDYRKGSE